MIEGFYVGSFFPLVLILKNHSLHSRDIYEVTNSKLRLIKHFYISDKLRLIMPFDHYPSLEELQQLPELFI